MKLINCFRTSGGFIFPALLVLLAGQLAEAEYVVFESATMGPTGQVNGYEVSNIQYIGTRFYVDRQLEVTQIGGHIAQFVFGADFFGAIVALSGPSGLPSGYPFIAGEIRASTVFNPSIFSSDFRTQLSVILPPGYYALIFGTDALGSSNGYGIMPFAGQTSFPSASYFIFWPGAGGWYNTLDEGARFVMEGFISDELLYCDGSGSDLVEYQYIMGVEVGTINNIPTDNDHYRDYTSLSTIMEPGFTYPLTITRGNPYHDYWDQCGAWVDWNQDGDFYDVGEEITMSLGFDPCTFTGTITPPAGAATGSTRLRIRILWVSAPYPCGTSDYGEVEDYTITIPGDTGGISGMKFNDLNGNGRQDGGEQGLAGWQIYLDLNNNGQNDIGEPSIITGADGSYELSGLTADTYTVAEVKQAGWKQTFPTVGGAHLVTVTEGATTENINFGNWQSSGSVVYLKAIDDTYADSGNPDTNYGSENSFYSGESGSSIYNAYVKFDLSSIPPGNVVVSAILRINNKFISTPAPTLTILQVSGDNWDESEVTGNHQPFVGGFLPTTGVVVSGDTTLWDATEDVDEDYVDDGFYSLQISSFDISEDRSARFFSKESGNAHIAPTLEVEYVPIFGGGTGEPNDPYQIRTGEQLNRIGLYSNRWSKHYKLMNNISLAGYSGSSYNIIGISGDIMHVDGPFMGVFDGNNHSISDFSYSRSNTDYVGIFGYVSGGAVRNLKVISPNLTDVSLDDMRYVGPIAGCIYRSDISGCSVVGGTVEGKNCVGGLCGLSRGSFIADCSSSASVSGTSNVGGLVGSGSSLGGFPHIADSYAQGAVSGNDYVGGFIGDSSDTGIVNCYSTGVVSGNPDANVGGFSGYNVKTFPVEGVIIGCFWDVESSGEPNSAGGTPLTTAQMYDENTFLNAGWDFVGEPANGGSDDWSMPASGGYPIMWHELPAPPALPSFAGGSGTAGDPYLIGTEAQLNSIGHNSRLMDKHFELISDLDMEGLSCYLISNRPYVFSGTFEGGDYTISNITFEAEFDKSYVGFIGSLRGAGASIQNLTLSEPNIASEWGLYVGSLVGLNDNGTITNCHAVNTHVVGFAGVGGLVGVNYYGRISDCSATGDVSDNSFLSFTASYVGGFVGENSYISEIVNSYAKCNVSGDDCVGGFAGINLAYSVLTNCYSQGNVTGTEDFIGGLIGNNVSSTKVNYCYSSSVVTGPAGTDSVGGFVGKMGTSGREYYTACFWDSEINPALPGIGNGVDPNVVGESMANMQTATTFTNVGWDFVGETVNGPNDIWDNCEGMNYPKLSWQIPPLGDFGCPDGVNFFDFSFFASQWDEKNCGASNDCDGRDLDLLGSVDIKDLRIFAYNWLAGF